MKILVCISKTPETTAKISFTNDNKEFNTDGVQYILNPYDEWYALVRAVELQEQHGGTVTVVNVGPASNDIVIRKALAIGATDAVRIDAEPHSSLFVAKQIAAHAAAASYDLVICGKETIDYHGNEVAGMLAELLDLPYVSYATKLEVEGTTATVTREIEGGAQTVRVQFPFVVSAAKGMAEQRIPNMRGIMMAKRKPLNVVPAVDAEDKTTLVSYELPSAKGGVRLIDADQMDELVRLLKEEAKVL